MRVFCLLLLLLPWPASARRAVVIGADDGGVGLPALRYAESDAAAVGAVLEQLGGFDVTRLAGPSVAEVRAALAAEALAADPSEPFLLYLSAHADVAGVRLGDELYPWDALRRDLGLVPAAVRIGVLDTCRSGVLARGAAVGPRLLPDDAVTGEAWLAAAGPTEEAIESERLGGGAFTHHWLAALRGAAAGADGLVSLSESWAYAAGRTAADSALSPTGAQRPVRRVELSGHGDVVLTRLSAATAIARIPAGVSGPLALLHAGRLLAEVEVPADGADLAVPPGRITLRRRAGDIVVEAVLDVSVGETHAVTSWRPAARDHLARRGLGPVGDDLAAEARSLDDVDAALHDLDRRAAHQSAALQVLDGLVAEPGVLRLRLHDELGPAWVVEAVRVRVDGALAVDARSIAGVDLDALHVDTLAPGGHRLDVELRLRPRATEWVDYLDDAAIEVSHSHPFTVHAGVRTRLDVTASARRAPWLDWSERPQVVVATQEQGLVAGS